MNSGDEEDINRACRELVLVKKKGSDNRLIEQIRGERKPNKWRPAERGHSEASKDLSGSRRQRGRRGTQYVERKMLLGQGR